MDQNFKKYNRRVVDEAVKLGCTQIDATRRGKHYIMTAVNSGGGTVRLFLASTPSDRRACKNDIARLRRVLRGC